MGLTLTQKVLWATPFAVNLILLWVFYARQRWRQFPIFTAWIVFAELRTIALFLIYMLGTRTWYMRVYVPGIWVDFALQIAILFEIARVVLRPTGAWVRDAAWQFILAATGGVAVAALITWGISVSHARSYMAWEMRTDLFTSIVMCEFCVALNITSRRLGLGWRSHVMAIGQAITAWTSVMLVSTAVQSYLHNYGPLYSEVDSARIVAYILAICWIAFQLWKDEPERRPIDPDLEAYILALHQRVEYDLRRIDA